MQYQAYIFDLDGTLLDTLTDLAAAANYSLREHNLPERSVDEVRMFVGNGIRNLISRAVPAGTDTATQEAVFATFNVYYKEHCADCTQPYPGILQLLAKLRQQGCKTAIVSNKANYAVQELARQYFDGLLDAACGERAGIARKPAPDMLHAILEQLQVPAAAAIYIGDSDTDLLTAANAGLPCIGACWGFRGRDFLLAHGATLLAETAEDIYTLTE